MGWSLCIASERDRDRALALERQGDAASEEEQTILDESLIGLSRSFSYELLRGGGQLRRYLDAVQHELLEPDSLDDPRHWEARDADALVRIFRHLRERLAQDNDRMP